MAISLKATGSWAELTADGAVTIPGSPSAGDRMFVWAAWKDFAITAQVSGWTEITEFADGSVTAGSSTGSVKVGCWYRDWESGDSNPTVDFSSSPSIALVVCQLWASTEPWGTPLFATAPWPLSSSGVVSATSGTTTVPDGSVVMAALGIRDDTDIEIDDIDVASGITWDGDIVQSTTPVSTATNQDLAAHLGHRFVTTGETVTLRVSGQLDASETGSIVWVVQGVSTEDATGEVAATLQEVLFSGTGAQTQSGEVAAVLQEATFSGAGNQPFTASVTSTLTAATFAGTGTRTFDSMEGELAATVSPATFSGSGVMQSSGVLAATTTRSLFEAGGGQGILATLAATLQEALFTGAGTPEQTGTLTATLQRVLATITADNSYKNSSSVIEDMAFFGARLRDMHAAGSALEDFT